MKLIETVVKSVSIIVVSIDSDVVVEILDCLDCVVVEILECIDCVVVGELVLLLLLSLESVTDVTKLVSNVLAVISLALNVWDEVINVVAKSEVEIGVTVELLVDGDVNDKIEVVDIEGMVDVVVM